MGGDDGNTTELLSTQQTFGNIYAEATAWEVPPSDRYPDGVKYSMQYGTTDGDTIFRYDNFPDHPGAPRHHKHIGDETVEPVEYTSLFEVFRQFKEEVNNHENGHWN